MNSRIALFALFVIQLWLAPPVLAQTPLQVNATVGGVFTQVLENGSLAMPSDGSPLTASIFVTYTGSGTATINQFAIAGQGYSLVSTPATPFTVPSAGTFSFQVLYTPIITAATLGQMTIGLVETVQSVQTQRTFTFSLNGTSPNLTFSALMPDNTLVSVASGGRIVFPLTRVKSSSTVAFIVTNSGSGTATLSSLNVGGSDFQLTGSPGLPATIPAGQEARFSISFAPQMRGTSMGNMQLGTATRLLTFTLEGAGSAPDFLVSYVLRSDNNGRILSDGGTVGFAATPALTTAQADFSIFNQGNGAGRVNNVTVSGESFQLTGLTVLPANVAPGQSVSFSVQFSPRRLGSFSGNLQIDLEDRTVRATLTGSTSSAGFTLTYVDPQTTNTLTVPEGGALIFPVTTAGLATTFLVSVQNQGPGTGFLRSISVNGDGFQLLSLPAFPVTIGANQQVQFGLRFLPTASQQYSGTLQLDVSDRIITVRLEGSSVGPALSYQLLREADAFPLAPDSSTEFSGQVGQIVPTTVTIVNRGTADAQIASIGLTGTGFALASVPQTPLTLRVNQSESFVLNFAPAQPGTLRARLRIGTHIFDLVGLAAGPQLVFAVTNEAARTPVVAGDILLLSPARVGESTAVEFTLQNSGTAPAAIATIDLQPSTVFTLEGTPLLPATLVAGGELKFTIRFTPNNLGNLGATLRVNGSSFGVSGNGQPPATLPAHIFSGPSGVQEPLQQPAIGLRLSAPYPLPLRGTLGLNFVSEVFAANPAVQFASGGRSVNFTIPANGTQAVFESGATEIRLQTGTTAGTINVTPQFLTEAGLDVTPPSPRIVSMTIGRLAPRLLDIRVPVRTLSTFALTLVGYSTTRSLRQVEFQITPRGDNRFPSSRIVVNLESAALAWFQGGSSQPFGGLFSITVPFALSGGDQNEDMVRSIQSVTVTITSEVGASNSLTVELP